MIDLLIFFFCTLGGGLTTIGIIYLLRTVSDKYIFKQMLRVNLTVLTLGIVSIVIGYSL